MSVMSRKHVTYNDRPQTTDYTGRRLVLAPWSFRRVVDLRPQWWEDKKTLMGSCWNGEGLAELLDAVVAPSSVVIIDLSQRCGDHVTHLSLSTLWKLDGFSEMRERLSGRIGQLRIHTGYDITTDITKSFSVDCSGGDSIVHFITAEVWDDLFQVHHIHPDSATRSWVRMVMTIGGLSEPVRGMHRMGPLVDAGFTCSYDQIVEVGEHWSGEQPSRFTTYETVRSEE
jgi:hypothetical protein